MKFVTIKQTWQTLLSSLLAIKIHFTIPLLPKLPFAKSVSLLLCLKMHYKILYPSM